MQTSRLRIAFLAIAFFCLALLGGAYYLQHGPDQQQPCPLCIMQRYAYMLVAFFALLGGMVSGSKWPARLIALFAWTSAQAGIFFTGWQLAKGEEMTSCMSDPIGQFVNGLPMRHWWPDYLLATGGCADKYPPIFGLSLPAWSMVCFVMLSVATTWLLVNLFRARGGHSRQYAAPMRRR
jgi:protein dithiol:quinone oxidoreductase